MSLIDHGREFLSDLHRREWIAWFAFLIAVMGVAVILGTVVVMEHGWIEGVGR